jgi:hypothetical protein
VSKAKFKDQSNPLHVQAPVRTGEDPQRPQTDAGGNTSGQTQSVRTKERSTARSAAIIAGAAAAGAAIGGATSGGKGAAIGLVSIYLSRCVPARCFFRVKIRKVFKSVQFADPRIQAVPAARFSRFSPKTRKTVPSSRAAGRPETLVFCLAPGERREGAASARGAHGRHRRSSMPRLLTTKFTRPHTYAG